MGTYAGFPRTLQNSKNTYISLLVLFQSIHKKKENRAKTKTNIANNNGLWCNRVGIAGQAKTSSRWRLHARSLSLSLSHAHTDCCESAIQPSSLY